MTTTAPPPPGRTTEPGKTTIEIADLFAGAGGTSTGAEKAVEETGHELDLIAINHSPTAIASHQANHPKARHLVEDVSMVDPEEVVANGHLDILLASPECKYYSRARGGKPVKDQGRMNPWAIINWITKLDVTAVVIENVPEFTDWGPLLDDGRPDKSQKGRHFEAWYLTFLNLGYQAEWRTLNAADYGDATTRTRFFLLARKDGNPILWPEPSHAKEISPMFPERRKWRGADQIIDWEIEGNSLLDHPKYQRKPLCINTLRRVAKGLERHGGILGPLYTRLLGLPEYEDAPVWNGHTVPGISTPEPFIIEHDAVPSDQKENAGNDNAVAFLQANRTENAPKALSQPVPSPTSAGGGGSFIIRANAEPFLIGQQSGATPRKVEDPAPTIAAAGAISLTRPAIVQYYGSSYAQDTEKPLTAITSCNKHALMQPTLIEYYGNSDAADINLPVPTITTKARHGLATPTMEEMTAEGAAAAADLTGDLTPGPYLVPNFGERDDQDPRTHSVHKPLPTVTPRGAGHLVIPSMDDGTARNLSEEGIDPKRLILIDGTPYLLDIKYRMLNNRELARAMGFEDHESKYEFIGTVSEVTKQIGNAVPVHLAAALVKSTIEAGNLAPSPATAPERV